MEEQILHLIIDGLDIYGIKPETKEIFKRMIKNYGGLRYNEGFLDCELKQIFKPIDKNK